MADMISNTKPLF